MVHVHNNVDIASIGYPVEICNFVLQLSAHSCTHTIANLLSFVLYCKELRSCTPYTQITVLQLLCC